MNYLQRFSIWLSELAKVEAVAVGKEVDGLLPFSAGTVTDRDYAQLVAEFNDAREAWRKNPLARRIVGLVTAYVVGGQGVQITSKRAELAEYCRAFMTHPENRIALRQVDWCDELTRAGELFLVLHMDTVAHLPYVRAVPASQIKQIEWREGDYEAELLYKEFDQYEAAGKSWRGWRNSAELAKSGLVEPIMLHYAVNRAVGNVRGESDLLSILPWLQRYSRWLEDRVRLNAAMRSWLWIVKAPKSMIETLQAKYKTPPAPGSVLIVERDAEEWDAVTPSISAGDVAMDGRAVRWMVAAGGPGTSLSDLGEGEGTNRATAAEMSEQRRRFLRLRQAYFGWMIADLVVQSWNWSVRLGLRRRKLITHDDLVVLLPDVSPDDNLNLSRAAREMARGMVELRGIVGDSEELRRISARLTMKFAGENLGDDELENLLGGTVEDE